MFKRLHVATFLGALVFASVLSAQTEGKISGEVTDPSGAHVVGAAVTALNTDTGRFHGRDQQ